MRTTIAFLAAAVLILTVAGSAEAQGVQGVAPSAPQPAAKGLARTSGAQPPDVASNFVSSPIPAKASDQPSQPMSLGDLARAARAKKNADAKVARVYDDDNFPRSASVGAKAPEISIATAQGGSTSLSQQSGKVVLLDFWASWCGPCRGSLPDLKRFISSYGGDNLEVIGISEDDDENDWRDFVARNQMNWPQHWDSDGSMRAKYGVNGLPTYVLIGSDGVILQRYVGASQQVSLGERIGNDLKQALEAQR